MEIIKADDKQLETVMSLRLEMLREVNGLSEEEPFSNELVSLSEEYFGCKEQTTVLAYKGKEAAGCASICYFTLMPPYCHPTGKRAHIMNVYVRESCRRQGLAAKMVQLLIEEARERGVTEISLDATEAGRPVYEKCGFKSSGESMTLNLRQK